VALDVGTLASQILTSLIVPVGTGAIFLIRQQRRKLAAEAHQLRSAADETDAKAEVLLSGEALELFKAARQDATDARAEARVERADAAEARREAGSTRRALVELWAANDAWDRHARHLEALFVAGGGTVPPRPLDVVPRIPDHN
jgi:hypothetical protein